jgi:hydrogenase maturation protease
VSRVVVIGVGNPFRRDDGVGPALVAAARPRLPPEVDVVEIDGEATALLDAWTGAEVAVVVDTVTTGARAGTVHRLEVGRDPLGGTSRFATTHALGVGEAVRLGAALGRLPRRIVIVGVEPGDLAHGTGLSDAVAAAVPTAAQRLVDEVVGLLADGAEQRIHGGG